MSSDFLADAPLPYPSIKRKVSWLNGRFSEEYLVPVEDKPKLLQLFYPFEIIPAMNDTLGDSTLSERFRVADFKMIREGNMNFLASPYYYRGGGTVLNWEPFHQPPPERNGPVHARFIVITETTVVLRVRSACLDRYDELMEHRRIRLRAIGNIRQRATRFF